ncbi:MAG: hypothetical protein AAF512_17290 [Pseudomonadota bacterium]
MQKTGNELLELGVIGLANTNKTYPYLWFHGHKGAAVLAAYFMIQEAGLDNAVNDAVAGFGHKIIAEDSGLFVEDEPDHGTADPGEIMQALEASINALSADGHDVIFSSLALKAFQAHPELATPSRVAGITVLIKACQFDNPKRYYGFEDYRVDSIDYSSVPSFENPKQAATYTLFEHEIVYPDQAIDGQNHFLAGDKLHDVTHAHALLELENIGYQSVAMQGLEALRKQFYLSDTTHIPEAIQAFETDLLFDPRTLSFWQRDIIDAHQVKLAYSVLSLLQHVDESQHDAILVDMSKYWALLP